MGRRRLRHPQHRLAAGAARAGPASTRRRRSRSSSRSRSSPRRCRPSASRRTPPGCRSRVGCNNTCTFCIVPSLRGKEKDRRPGEILAEVEALVAEGVLEVTLLGQNVNAYGVEFGDRQAFAKLLRACGDDRGPGAGPLHLPHPADFTDDVIEAMAETPNVMPLAAHAAAVRLGPGAQGDAPLLPPASATSASSTGSAPRCPTPRSPPTSSSASPARPRRTSEQTLDVVRAGPVRRRLHLPVLQAARHPGRRRWTTRCRKAVVQERYERLVALVRTRSPGRRTSGWSAARVELLVAEGEGRKDAATHRLSGRARDNRLVHFAVPADAVPRPARRRRHRRGHLRRPAPPGRRRPARRRPAAPAPATPGRPARRGAPGAAGRAARHADGRRSRGRWRRSCSAGRRRTQPSDTAASPPSGDTGSVSSPSEPPSDEPLPSSEPSSTLSSPAGGVGLVSSASVPVVVGVGSAPSRPVRRADRTPAVVAAAVGAAPGSAEPDRRGRTSSSGPLPRAAPSAPCRALLRGGARSAVASCGRRGARDPRARRRPGGPGSTPVTRRSA